MKHTVNRSYLAILSIICLIVCINSCSQSFEDSGDYKFVLIDSIRLNIPVEPHFVEVKKSNDKILLYSRINSTFYVCNSLGEIILEHVRIGEGPGYYNKSVYQAGLQNEQLVIQDLKKIYKYNLKGDFLEDITYQPAFVYSSSGNIKNGLNSLNDSLIINPLAYSGAVTFNSNKLAAIDTISTLDLINTITGQTYDAPMNIRFEPNSIYKQDLVYPKFLPLVDITEEETIIIAYPYEQRLYEYGLTDNRLELINTIDFNLDQFKLPRGVKEDELTKGVNPILSKNAGLNSSILKIFGTKGKEAFILYSTGVPDRYEAEQALGKYYKESKLLGGLIKDGTLISSGIEIPNNGFEYMNEFQISYWGGNQWAFIQDNQEEQDYYQIYIYNLVLTD